MASSSKKRALQKWVKIIQDTPTIPAPCLGDTPIDGTSPSWYDKEELSAAQEVIRACISVGFCHGTGATLVTLIPGASFVFMTTGRSATPAHSFLRNLSTANTIQKWYEGGDLFDPGTEGHRSIMKIRELHKKIFDNVRKMDDTEKYLDWERWVNLFGLVITQWFLIGLIFTAPTYIGIHGSQYTKDVHNAVNTVWRAVGYLLGIPDEYNICADSVEVTIELCNLIQDSILIPVMEKDKEWFPMGYNLCLSGFDNFGLIGGNRISGKVYMTYWRSAFGLDTQVEQLTWKETIQYYILVAIFGYVTKVPYIRHKMTERGRVTRAKLTENKSAVFNELKEKFPDVKFTAEEYAKAIKTEHVAYLPKVEDYRSSFLVI